MNTNKLSRRLSFSWSLGILVIISVMIMALFQEEYTIAVVAWCTWGIMSLIHDAVDVIGEKIDEIQR